MRVFSQFLNLRESKPSFLKALFLPFVLAFFGLAATFFSAPVLAADYWIGVGDSIYSNFSGNVGIGTASPLPGVTGVKGLHLTASGSTTPVFVVEQTGGGATSASMYFFGGSSSGQGYFGYRNKFHIGTASAVGGVITEKFTIDSGGNVGIGTVSPLAGATGVTGLHLAVGGSTTPIFVVEQTGGGPTSASMYFFGGASSGQGYFGYRNKFNIGTASAVGGVITEKFTMDSYGNVGIGTVSPGAKLDVNGDIKVGGVIKGDSNGNVIVKLGN